jgi:hypothetical protein
MSKRHWNKQKEELKKNIKTDLKLLNDRDDGLLNYKTVIWIIDKNFNEKLNT